MNRIGRGSRMVSVLSLGTTVVPLPVLDNIVRRFERVENRASKDFRKKSEGAVTRDWPFR